MAKRKLVDGLWLGGEGTTTDGTNWSLIASLDMSSGSQFPDGIAPGDCQILCEGRLLGWEAANTQGATLIGYRSFRWFGGSSLIALESDPAAQIYSATNTNLATATLSIRVHDSISTTIAFYVKGTASHTIAWMGDMKVSLWQPT